MRSVMLHDVVMCPVTEVMFFIKPERAVPSRTSEGKQLYMYAIQYWH